MQRYEFDLTCTALMTCTVTGEGETEDDARDNALADARNQSDHDWEFWEMLPEIEVESSRLVEEFDDDDSEDTDSEDDEDATDAEVKP